MEAMVARFRVADAVSNGPTWMGQRALAMARLLQLFA